jgi:hypothetical protein
MAFESALLVLVVPLARVDLDCGGKICVEDRSSVWKQVDALLFLTYSAEIR